MQIPDELSAQDFNLSRSEAQRLQVCIRCRKPIEGRIYSSAGKREYKISGLCEKCFDRR